MKNYLTSDLNGKKLFASIFLLMLVVVGIIIWSVATAMTASAAGTSAAYQTSLLTPHTPLNGEWAVRLFGSLGISFAYLLIVYGILFFVVKLTLGSISYKGERMDTTEMRFAQFAPRLLTWTLLTVVTCFIYLPWLITNMIRYFCERVRLRGHNFRFNGSGSILFGFAVLCYVLPVIALTIMMVIFTTLIPHSAVGFAAIVVWIVLLAIILIAGLFYAFIIRWSIDYDYNGRQISAQSMTYGRAMWFIFGQILLTVITLGFYGPAFYLRLMRYVLRHTTMIESDGAISRQGGFDFRSRDYLFILSQSLLACITAGIYAPWSYAATVRRIAERSYTEEL